VQSKPYFCIVISSVSDGCYLQLKMLNTSLSLFFLRAQPFPRFDFPRWYAVLAVSLIGVLMGLDPSLAAMPPVIPEPPLWLIAVLGFPTMARSVRRSNQRRQTRAQSVGNQPGCGQTNPSPESTTTLAVQLSDRSASKI
jgi:hypothetical protein